MRVRRPSPASRHRMLAASTVVSSRVIFSSGLYWRARGVWFAPNTHGPRITRRKLNEFLRPISICKRASRKAVTGTRLARNRGGLEPHRTETFAPWRSELWSATSRTARLIRKRAWLTPRNTALLRSHKAGQELSASSIRYQFKGRCAMDYSTLMFACSSARQSSVLRSLTACSATGDATPN